MVVINQNITITAFMVLKSPAVLESGQKPEICLWVGSDYFITRVWVTATTLRGTTTVSSLHSDSVCASIRVSEDNLCLLLHKSLLKISQVNGCMLTCVRYIGPREKRRSHLSLQHHTWVRYSSGWIVCHGQLRDYTANGKMTSVAVWYVISA